MPCRCFALLLLLAGCSGYDPPLAGDHAATGYRADLAKCQAAADTKARRTANATPQSAIGALFASDAAEREDVTICMAGRGHPPR